MAKPIDKYKALHELLRQAADDRVSVTRYKAACRALVALEIPQDDYKHALSFLGYARSDTGELYQWLTAKLGAKK